MMNDFLAHFGCVFKQEGSQLVIDCPQCGKEKHCHVAPDTGLWHCKVCDGRGNPWQLVEMMQPALDSKGIYAMLREHGLASGEPYSKPDKKPQPSLSRDDLRAMTEAELDSVCAAKQLTRDALLKFTPYAHARQPWMLLPAFEPGNPSKACGWLRCRLDGAPIVLGNGNSVKYPIVSGSVHGLFGLKTLMDAQTETIIFAEAWRDALAAISLGFYATASSGGASTWYDAWLPVFKDKQVYIIMDRDKAGLRAAKRAAEAIGAVAKSVKIVDLPYELTKDHGKDLHDWIVVDGHSRQDVEQLLQAAKTCTAPPPPDDEHVQLPDDNPDTMAEAFETWSRDTCGVMHRYNQIDGWSLYYNDKYQLVENEEEIEKYIRDFIRDHVTIKARRKNEDGTYSTYYAKPDRKLKSAQYVTNVIKWLRDMPGVHLRPGQKAPCSLDGSLNPNTILAMQNGLLDITDRKNPRLLPFTPDFYTFNYFRFAYDPTQKAPTWLWAMGQYFQDDDGKPDSLVPDILHSRIKKYLLRDTRDHKILAIIGRRRSGKGTIARTIQELMGGHRNVATVTISILASDFGLQPLINKQLAIMWDASLAGRNGDTNKAVEILKNISGEDGVQINRKGKPHLNLEKLPINILVVANKVLDLRDSTGALAGRFTFLETTKSFYGHEDSTIEEKISKEIPGIFNLILAAPEGQLLEHPQSHILQAEFEELSSPYIAFINEWCVIDPDEFIPTDVLWKYYCQWCQENGHQSPSAQKFKMDFIGAHDDIKRYRPQLTYQQVEALELEFNLNAKPGRKMSLSNRPQCYRGVTIKEEIKTTCWTKENL